MKNKLIKLIRWIWEFPQCLLGLILIHLYDVDHKETINNIDVYVGRFPSGISLGLYIIMSNYSYRYSKTTTMYHEYGHSIQSKILGPLYLPTVGITSITWNGLRKIFTSLRSINYYSIWPESWADKLGNVKR